MSRDAVEAFAELMAQSHRARAQRATRGTSNTNSRGSSYQRRARRARLVGKYGSASGKTIKCHWCSRRMRTRTARHPNGTFEVDRWPICGHDGGTYADDNVVPACAPCNGSRCKIVGKRCRGRAPAIRKALYERRLVE